MQVLKYETIKQGVTAQTIRDLIGAGRLRRSDVQMVIPARTLERRLSGNQMLKIDEADAIARQQFVTTSGDELLGQFDVLSQSLGVLFDKAVADATALGERECVGHRTADEYVIANSQQVTNDLNFVGNLGSA